MRLKRARLTVLLAVSGVLLAAVQLASSNSNKLCCDPDCSQPISLARSRVRYIPKNKQFLSFPARASITVLAKNVGNEDTWEGKIFNTKGLIHKNNLEELQVLCPNPQHWTKEEEEEDDQQQKAVEQQSTNNGNQQTNSQPPVDNGNQQTDSQPPVDNGNQQTNSQPPVDNGNQQTDSQPPVDRGQQETNNDNQQTNGQQAMNQQTDSQPPVDNGNQLKTDSQLPIDNSNQQTNSQPPVDNGNQQTDNQPPVDNGNQQTNNQPPVDNGNQQTNSQPPVDNGNQQTRHTGGWQEERYVAPPPTFDSQPADPGSPAGEDWTEMNNMFETGGDPSPVPDEVKRWRGQQLHRASRERGSAPPQEGGVTPPEHRPTWSNPNTEPRNDPPRSDESSWSPPPTTDTPTNQDSHSVINDDQVDEDNDDFFENVLEDDSERRELHNADSPADVGGANQQSPTPPMNYEQEQVKEELSVTTPSIPIPLPSVLNNGNSEVKGYEEQSTSDSGTTSDEQRQPADDKNSNEPIDSHREEAATTHEQQGGQEAEKPSEAVETTQSYQQPSPPSDIPPPLQQQQQQQEYSSYTPPEEWRQHITTQQLPPQPSPSVEDTTHTEHTPSFTPGLDQWRDQPINDQHNNQPITDQQANNQPITDQQANNQPITDQQANNQPITDQQANNQPITDQQADQPITDQQANNQSINDQQANQQTTDQQANNQPITDQQANNQSINDQQADQPITDQQANQPITDQQVITDQQADQPITDQQADQPIDDHPITDSSTTTVIEPITDQPITDPSTTITIVPSSDPISERDYDRPTESSPSEPPVHYQRDAGRGFSFEERDMDCPPCSVPIFLQLAYNVVPDTVAEQLMAMGPDVAIVAVLATSIAIMIPLCLSCCSSWKSAAGNQRKLQKEKAARTTAEKQVKKLNSEKSRSETDIQNLTTQLQGCQEELERDKQGLWDLENIKLGLEEEKQALTQSVTSLQLESSQYQTVVHQLQGELSTTKTQLATAVDDQSRLHSQLQESQQRRQELEAAKDQLEQEIYNAQQSLSQLKQLHGTLTEEHSELQSKCQNVEEQLESTQTEWTNLGHLLEEKETEIQTLKRCLQQLSNGGKEEEEDQGEDEEHGAKLDRIQALLDTTKAQTDLRVMTEERDRLQQQVLELAQSIDQLRSENKSLEEEVSSLHSDRELVAIQNQETQVKLKTLTEYFEQKELHLHKKLGAEEVVRQQVQSREALAVERATVVEQEREKEREELKELRKQMTDIEKSLMQQVMTNEKRAEDALSQLRRTEQDLRTANREVTVFKRQIADMEGAHLRPPSPGRRPLPPPDRRSPPAPRPPYDNYNQRGPPGPPPPGPPGPPPGPPPGHSLPSIRPRTSSPMDEVDARSAHNETHPPLNGQGRPLSRGALDQRHSSDHMERSRPPPPGMEARDPYQFRPQDPHHMGPPRSRYSPPPRGYPPPGPPGRPRSSMSERSLHEESFERPRHSQDRPPIPGNLEHRPRMPPPSDFYPPDRRRPPSGPTYSELSGDPPYHPPGPPPPRGMGYPPPRGPGYVPRAGSYPPPRGGGFPPRDPRILSSPHLPSGPLRPMASSRPPPPTHSLPGAGYQQQQRGPEPATGGSLQNSNTAGGTENV